MANYHTTTATAAPNNIHDAKALTKISGIRFKEKHLFIYVLRLEIQLSRGEGWDQFDPTLFLCLDLLNVFSYSVI
jgi:hypothetical protein